MLGQDGAGCAFHGRDASIAPGGTRRALDGRWRVCERVWVARLTHHRSHSVLVPTDVARLTRIERPRACVRTKVCHVHMPDVAHARPVRFDGA
eukprot:2158486-Rhodomonas_salina.1